MKNLYPNFLFIIFCNLFCSCELLNKLVANDHEQTETIETIKMKTTNTAESHLINTAESDPVLVAVEIPSNSSIINLVKEEKVPESGTYEVKDLTNIISINSDSEKTSILETAKDKKSEEKTIEITVIPENHVSEKSIQKTAVPLAILESLAQDVNKNQALENNKNTETYLPIAGYLEKIWIFGGRNNAVAKLDTGADTCSIDASNIVQFEKDGKKWIRFTIKLGEKSEEKSLPKKRTIFIKRHGSESLKRYVVEIDVQLGETRKKVEFTLSDREKFNYPILIGRNFLGSAILVDSANTFLLSKED